MINYITYLSTLIISLILGFLVIKKRDRRPSRISFFLLTLSIVLWVLTLLITDTSKTTSTALWFGRFSLIGPILIPYLLVIFSYYFPYIDRKLTKRYFFLLALPVILLLFFVPTKFNIKQAILHDWGAETIPGFIYYFFIIYFFLYGYFAFKRLFRKYKSSKGIFHEQIKYILLGVSVSTFLAILTNAVIPLFGIVSLSILGPPSLIFFLAFTAYAIIKHRFLDIHLILRKSFIYVGLAFFVVFAYYFALWLDNTFFGGSYSIGGYLSAVVIAPLFLLGFGYISKWLKHIANKYFFTGLYDYQKVLETFAKRISQTIKLDEV